MSSWKQAERQVAKRLGGRRVPVTGRARGDAPDIEHPLLSVEVKLRRRLPEWLQQAMQQAEAAARDGKLPVAVLHQAGARYDDALCLLKLRDLIGVLERWKERGNE